MIAPPTVTSGTISYMQTQRSLRQVVLITAASHCWLKVHDSLMPAAEIFIPNVYFSVRRTYKDAVEHSPMRTVLKPVES